MYLSLPNFLKRDGGLALIFGLSGGLLLLQLNNTYKSNLNILALLFGTLIPIVLSASVLAGGIWLQRQDLNEDDILRVGVGCTVGAVVFTLGAVLTIIYQQTRGVTMVDPSFMIGNTASGGAVVGFVVSVYYNRQRRAQAEANQLTRQVSVLNRVLRHDIRTKANIISGHAELLTDDSSEVVTQAHKIKQQTSEVVKIGNQARNIERMLHNSDEESDVIDLASRVETVCRGVKQDYPTAEIHISLPETRLVFAHPLVNSALRNVVENAIEHNDKQTPCVEISSGIISDNRTDRIEIRIADNGPGIPESEIKVLEDGYETELNHSSGLGLWLVNWIITNPGGNVRFETNEPEGSVVCLQLGRAERKVSPQHL